MCMAVEVGGVSQIIIVILLIIQPLSLLKGCASINVTQRHDVPFYIEIHVFLPQVDVVL